MIMTEQEQRAMADLVADRLLVLMQVVERIKGVETQIARFSSDIESEKRTRADATKLLADSNGKLDLRLVEVERSNWKSTGALAVLFLVMQYGPTIFKAISSSTVK